MADKVRVRYAPSPTGYPHVGNIRTALFNWLFARSQGGSFIVRIEDTDRARFVEGATEAILDGLNWLGIDWDEGPEKGGNYGPYFQSERVERYKEAAEKLVKEGKAYYCYCTPERLTEMREEQARKKQPPGYDMHCRNLTPEQIAENEAKGLKKVIRFKLPLEGQTTFTDMIRGEVSFENKLIDDFVILKSDGFPTYHLASIIDDSAMEISHVLRAEEWISSTPKHIKLYEALNLTPPKFAHMPMILGADRSKLSKRHGSVSINDYEKMGYLPETMLNFLALLGWALDDKTEIFSKSELIKYFSLERVNKTAAIFNIDKLDWLNGIYIRKLEDADLAERIMPFAEKELSGKTDYPVTMEKLTQISPLIKERIKLLSDAPELIDFFFIEPVYTPEALIVKKMDGEKALTVLNAGKKVITDLPEFTEQALEENIRPLAEALGLKTGQLLGTLRSAVSCKSITPPLFETMLVLGKDIVLSRIDKAIETLQKAS